MNDSKHKAQEPDTEERPQAESPTDSPDEEAVEAAEGEADAAAALKAENEELRDRLLRAVAEMENLRKRTEREVRDAGQYAITSFARDVLGVGDNMRRALDSVDAGAREAANPTLKTLLEGVEMTERELHNALDRHGVQRVDPAGERFDPHLHQAMFEVEDASIPSGTVVQVMQTGYTINGRVLRPAMVGVSRGGPKPGGAPAEQGDGGTEAPAASGAQGSTVNRTA